MIISKGFFLKKGRWLSRLDCSTIKEEDYNALYHLLLMSSSDLFIK